MLPLEHSAILLTYIKRYLVLKKMFGLFESCTFRRLSVHSIWIGNFNVLNDWYFGGDIHSSINTMFVMK